MHRSFVVASLVAALASNVSAQTDRVANQAPALLKTFRPIGGVENNLQHPSWNAVPGAPQLKIAPFNFAPGTVNGPVSGPNPRTISNLVSGGAGLNGVNAETDDSSASAWLYVFGQFVDHDIDLEDTPVTSPAINILIPAGDTVFTAGTSIAMNRATRDPATNTIINTTAGYLDLSQLYGSTTAAAQSLRNADGTLKSSGNGLYLPVSNDSFITGDPRVMENPELSAVTTLFMREHNYWVRRLAQSNPRWSGDDLYNMAKAITTAEYQNIIYNEFLPLVLGTDLGAYHGYNPNINAQVTQEFSTAAFRMGHSEVSGDQTGLDNAGNVTFSQSLAQAFFNTASMDVTNGVNALLRGITADGSLATDVYTDPSLRNLLFAPLVGGDIDELDLIAIDIQRERDVGLGSLNQTRRALGFAPYTNFSQVTGDPVLAANLQTVFGDVDNLDLFIGGLAEDHQRGADVGPTFRRIIAMTFASLRDGDRFFWNNQGFDNNTAAAISATTLANIIKRNTDTVSVRPKAFRITSPTPRTHHHPPSRVDSHGRFPIVD